MLLCFYYVGFRIRSGFIYAGGLPENGYSVIKDEFERYKAGVEREKAETERRAAESNAFIDRILQNECKFILFDGNCENFESSFA